MNQTIMVRTGAGDVSVEFTDDRIQTKLGNTLLEEQTLADLDPGQANPRSVAIWRRYQQVHAGNFVVRSGLGNYGCYGKSYNPLQPSDAPYYQSDSEHANTCVELLRNLRYHYPDLLPAAFYFRAEQLLASHDLGENAYGDRPDDGSQNRSEKDRIELINFAAAAATLPPAVRAVAIADFIRFQDPLCRHYAPLEGQMAQLARCVDKADAVLSGLIYEQSGRPGNLLHKHQSFCSISAQDRYFANQAAGDTSLVAGWCAHFIYSYHAYYGFPYLLSIIKAGVIDVRGAWFPWFGDFCNHHEIPTEHLELPTTTHR